MLVGPRGEKQIIKGTSREDQEGVSRGKSRQGASKRKTRTRDSDTGEEDKMEVQESQRARRK